VTATASLIPAHPASPLLLARPTLLARLQAGPPDGESDVAVIGGGCVGLGLALDAVARGFSVLLLEAGDFAGGTSSRATKLVHGGVRYLAKGDIALVREALRERAAMLANAPHLAQPLPFVMPAYQWWELGLHGAALKAYDLLAGGQGLGPTQALDEARTRALLPGAQPRGLRGGVRYWDAQFDDARYAIALARTAAARGALLLNHCAVTALLHEHGQVRGVAWRCAETGLRGQWRARCVVNATGVWADEVRRLDEGVDAPPLLAPSQGVHLVVDRRFLPGGHALLVPRTGDGRVLFAVPWLGKTVLGTTDTPRPGVEREPRALPEEVGFILREAARYLAQPPQRSDVRSIWAGLRPLVQAPAADPAPGQRAPGGSTQRLSREHLVRVAESGLVTVTGGKWTTYRAMAEDVLEQAMRRGLLPPRPAGATLQLRLAAAMPGRPLHEPPGPHLYGAEAGVLQALPGAGHGLWHDPEAGSSGLSEAMVRFAARYEMARTVEDVLARRSRLLFLDAAAAAQCAPAVGAILQEELGPQHDVKLQVFEALAAQYGQLP
jgi:glycerol-3-phosphate dehydrogenase